MLGIGGLPSLIMFLGFLGLAKSPRWLLSKGMVDQANKVMRFLRESDEKADEEFHDIVNTLLQKGSRPGHAILDYVTDRFND